jgi:thiol:disulfide interchange protein DsbD
VLGIRCWASCSTRTQARALRIQGWSFFAGTVLSFLLLAGIMLALRAGGAQLGWGFQLQSPGVVMLLAALFFVLALTSRACSSGAPSRRRSPPISPRADATPMRSCRRRGFGGRHPVHGAVHGRRGGLHCLRNRRASRWRCSPRSASHGAAGAAPGAFPRAHEETAAAGRVDGDLQQVLAFPLYATVAWLTWVLGAQAGNDAVLALLAGLVLVAMAAWMFGKWEHSAAPWRAAVASILAIAGLVVAWPGPSSAARRRRPHARASSQWEEWSPEKVAQLTAAGQAVFVDFTAAWCVTCQVNKRVALHNAAVVREFAARGVVPLRADWTRQDPRITARSRALGRNAVPVYALYLPGRARRACCPKCSPPRWCSRSSRVHPPSRAAAITQR